MKLDIFTLLTMLCMASFIEFLVLFIQYRVNKIYQGIGLWVLGYASIAAGYMLLFLRGIIPVKLVSIIAANSLILLGSIFLYLGLMRFIEKKENRGIVFAVFSFFLFSYIYYTYFNDDIKLRTVIIYSAVAIISLLTVKGLFSCRNYTFKTSLYFNIFLFTIQSCFNAYRPFDVLFFESFGSLFTPTMMQTVSFLFMFIEGILITFGLIVMVNQRLNAENMEDKDNLELIFSTNPDSVLITRLNDGIIVKINDGFTLMTGFTGSDVIGKSLIDVRIWTDQADRQKLISLLTEKGFCYNLEYVFRRKDESQFNGLVSARIISLQEIPHIISVTKDVTNRKQSEDLVNQTRKNYETFFNAIDDFLFVLDEQGNIIHTNNTVINRLGYTMEELTGLSVLMVHPPERRDEAGRIVGEMLSGTADVCPVPIITKAGVQIPVETMVSPGFWDGKPVIFGVTKDISKIKLSEEKFSKLFYINPSACGLTDLDNHKYIEVNDAFYALLGFEKSEVIGKTAVELCILDANLRNEVLMKADISGKLTNVETVLKAKNGDIKHVLLSAENITVQDKRYRFTVIHDITDSKKAEAALRESELKYRSLIENTSDVVFCVNEKGEYQFANNVFASTFGQTPEYFTGKTFWDIYPREHADQRQEASRKVFETGETQTVEVTVPLPGRTMYFLAKANPIKNETGKVILNLTTATDITDRKLMEETLRAKSKELDRYFTSSLDLLCIATTDGSFLRLNPEWERVLGYSIQDLEGRSFLDFVHPDDMESTLAAMSKLEAQESVFSFENRYCGKDGNYRWIEWRSSPQGNVIYAAARDITERKRVEDALRRSEEKIRSINNNMQSGMIYQIVISKDGSRKYTYLSDSVRILYGVTPEEAMADPGLIYSKVHEDDVSRLVEDEKTAIRTFSTLRSEHRVRMASGDIRWAVLTSVPKLLDDGSICFDGIEFDVTGRRQAEEALRDSEEQLRNLFENAPVGIFHSLWEGRFLAANPAMAEMLGYSSTEELIAATSDMTTQIYVDPEIRPKIMDSLKKTDGWVHYNEVKWRRKDNRLITIDMSGRKVFNTRGDFLYLEGFIEDITERKLAEEALRDSEEKLSTLFGSMTEMVVLHELVFNEHGDTVNYRITDCNNAFTEVAGIKRENAIGRLATDLYQTEYPPYFEEYSRVALTGIPYEYTTYFEPMDKHFSISVVSPKKNNFATITTDITEIRKVQEVISAKNKELENYLYIASHDLRSPLVNIQGFSRRLQKQTDSINSAISGSTIAPETKEIIVAITVEGIPKTLNYIFSSVKKMDILLNGLLNVSRTGRTVLNIKRIDSNKLFKTIIGNYNFQLTEIDAVVKVTDLPPCYGDQNLLNQLFSNIIGNAIKYRDKNRKLIIEITSHQEYRKVVYSIRDNGLGIDSRHIDKIWDVFYRADSGQGDTGEGLGLSIVKRIAEKHNGSVRVESEPGSGSVFHVELQNNTFSE